jgi:hypothetical protein
MPLNPEDIMSVAVKIQVSPPTTATPSVKPNPEDEVSNPIPSLQSLSLEPEQSKTPIKGRIIVHCIRHAEVSRPPATYYYLNPLTAVSSPSAI